jgi:hypothetical protein
MNSHGSPLNCTTSRGGRYVFTAILSMLLLNLRSSSLSTKDANGAGADGEYANGAGTDDEYANTQAWMV